MPSLVAGGVYKLEYMNRHGKNLVARPKLTVYDDAGDVVMKHGEPVASKRIPRSERTWRFIIGIGYAQDPPPHPRGFLNPYLYFIPETSGAYYLKVNSVINDTGHYDIWYRSIDTIDKGDRTGRDCMETFDSTCRISPSTGRVEGKFHPTHRFCDARDECTAYDNDRYWVYFEYGATYTLCLATGGDNRDNHTQDGFSSPDGLFEDAWRPGCIEVTPQFRTKAYELGLGGRELAHNGTESRDYILKYKIITTEAERIKFVPEGRVGSTSEPAGEDLPNDDDTTGFVQPNGLPATGNISPQAEGDRFKTHLTAGHKYRVDVIGSSGSNPGGTLDDPILQIWIGGTILAQDLDSGQGQNARSEFTASTTGAYEIRVYEEGDNATGTYTVTVKRIE